MKKTPNFFGGFLHRCYHKRPCSYSEGGVPELMRLSTYTFRPNTEPAYISVWAKYQSTESEISPWGGVQKPMKDIIMPEATRTIAMIVCMCFMGIRCCVFYCN